MGYDDINTGFIEVIAGPMFAGKSEELIRRINRLKYAKKKFLVFKPIIDDRYSTNEVVSHQKRKEVAIPINDPREVFNYVKDDIEVVCIDEVQFFSDEMFYVINELADSGKRVICAGLDCDFRGEPFSLTAKLLARAEFVTKLTAICVCCGKEATMTQRLINGVPASYDDPVVLVGASEAYEPRCRHCHEVLKNK